MQKIHQPEGKVHLQHCQVSPSAEIRQETSKWVVGKVQYFQVEAVGRVQNIWGTHFPTEVVEAQIPSTK